MPHHGLAASRTPPEHVNRTTRLGADQYVLACNARRDAGDLTFAQIELLERKNHELRTELRHELEHASARPEGFARRRMTVLACVIAGMAAVSGWMFTPNGREVRVVLVEAYYLGTIPRDEVWKTRHLITFDMTQAKIDAVNAQRRSDRARKAK